MDAKRSYIRRRDSTRQQVHALQTEHEALVKQLERNEYAQTMEDLEKKIRHKEQNNFALKECTKAAQLPSAMRVFVV